MDETNRWIFIRGGPDPGLGGWRPAGFPEAPPHLLLVTWIRRVQPIRSFNGGTVVNMQDGAGSGPPGLEASNADEAGGVT